MNNMVSLSPIEIIDAETPVKSPVDLQKLATRLGLSVDYRQDFPDNIAGAIVPDKLGLSSSGYAIQINAKDPENKKRFTLALEIARYTFHRDLIRDGVIDDEKYNSRLGGIYDHQAVRVAYDILMPSPLIRSYLNTTRELREISKAFIVPPAAAALRLRTLGL